MHPFLIVNHLPCSDTRTCILRSNRSFTVHIIPFLDVKCKKRKCAQKMLFSEKERHEAKKDHEMKAHPFRHTGCYDVLPHRCTTSQTREETREVDPQSCCQHMEPAFAPTSSLMKVRKGDRFTGIGRLCNQKTTFKINWLPTRVTWHSIKPWVKWIVRSASIHVPLCRLIGRQFIFSWASGCTQVSFCVYFSRIWRP